MKNKILIFSSLLVACVLLVAACHKIEDNDSVAQEVSLPVYISYIDDIYIYAKDNTHIYSDLPDVVGVAVDTVYGFDGGYGGKTGMDTIKILKTDIAGWPDTVKTGAKNLSFFSKYSKGNYRVALPSKILIVTANANPGPTAMEGNYLRAANGVVITLKRAGAGIYVIDNPGGAVTTLVSYLLYDYKSSTGADSLSFAIQPNTACNQGLQLVAPGAPISLTSAEYTTQYPPAIIETMPLTLSWRVYQFPEVKSTSVHEGVASCQWGTGVRTFVKQ